MRKYYIHCLSLFTLFALGFLPASAVRANLANLSLDLSGLNDPQKAQVTNFVDATIQLLPEVIVDRINIQQIPMQILFQAIDGVEVSAPKCISNNFSEDQADQFVIMEDAEDGARAKKEFADAIVRAGGNSRIRFDGKIHTILDINKNTFAPTIRVHSGFLPIILAGEKAAKQFPCGVKNMYKLAQASLLHSMVRYFDELRFKSTYEANLLSGRNAMCSGISQLKSTRGSKRMYLDDSTLYCIDLEESRTIVSERLRYRTLSGGWSGKPGSYVTALPVVWPRAVNTYANAYDVRTHFAYNMEQFLLDPTYACREPGLFEHLKSIFGDKYYAVESGFCRVNTVLPVFERSYENGVTSVALDYYDVDTKNVAGINYYRAGVGDEGISSSFGHSMYRVVGKPGANLLVDKSCPDEADGIPCDLIISHRANPVELRMDQMKGVFGGYPSQLLLYPLYNILLEYGHWELRHIFNIPLGQATDRGFDPMSDTQKTQFLNSAIQEFWTYVGSYKFVTNNCADEALRLYQMGSDNKGLAYGSVLKPSQIDEKVLGKLGLADTSVLNGVKEVGFIKSILGKVFWKSQKNYEKQREAVESNDFVDVSQKYTVYDALQKIMDMEGTKRKIWLVPQKNENVNAIEKEMKSWAKLATVASKAKDICKANELSETTEAKVAKVQEIIGNFRNRYNSLMSKYLDKYKETNDKKYWEQAYDANMFFYLVMHNVESTRRRQLGDLSIDVAYNIGYPDNGKDVLCTGKQEWKVTPEKRKFIKASIDRYAFFEKKLRPYSNLLVKSGYGIPLNSEVLGAYTYTQVANEQQGGLDILIHLLGPELGMDYELYYQVLLLNRDMCVDRVKYNLIKHKAPNCEEIYPQVYRAEKIRAERENGH